VDNYRYPFSNKWKAARERLLQLETVWDAWTIRNLEKVGVKRGSHCLEIAGGGGSIAEWLCSQVTSSGRVVATDLEPRFLEAIKRSNLEVWRHDIVSEPIPEGKFDLIHARAVLAFLPEPARVITKIIAALRHGGWLLLEELDYISAIPDPSMTAAAAALSQKGWNAVLEHLRSRGYDTECGRHLYRDLAVNDVVELGAEGFVTMVHGGTPSARFFKIGLEQVREDVLEADLTTGAELNGYGSLLDCSEFRWLAPTMMSVWGRRT
jgi:2-polyprenyl-3-methyl-5-hydroxy-6-metoxy-1,4-benzoquinol methylase